MPLVGAADGLALGDNLRGFLVAEAVRELAGIVQAMGGRADTAYTLAGLGDLVTSATSASSHHRRIGADLATGRSGPLAASGANIRSEGVHTAAMVRAHALFAWERFPLFALVCRFLDEPTRFEARLGDYLDRRFPSGGHHHLTDSTPPAPWRPVARRHAVSTGGRTRCATRNAPHATGGMQ